jgi:outer membrane lipase/esterase
MVFNGGESEVDGIPNPGVTGYLQPQDELNDFVQRINGEETQATQQQVGSAQAVQTSNIGARIEALRAGLAAPGLSLAGLSLDDGENVLQAGYDDDLLAGQGGTLDAPIWERLGVFLTGGGRFGDKSESSEVTGYDFWSVGLTVGADYRVRDDLVFGAAIGYSYYDVDFDTNNANLSGQDLESNSVSFSLFGTYFPQAVEGLFVDGLATIGWSWIDMSRRVVLEPGPGSDAPAIDTRANGDTDALFYGFAGNVGYDINIQQLRVTPVARVRFLRADIDDYEESGGGAVNLKFGSQDATSLTTHVGAEVGYAFSTRYGILEPSVRGEYVHEFLNDDDGVDVGYAADPNNFTFEVITEDPDRNYGVVGASLTGTFPAGWSSFLDFETVLGYSRYDIYALRAGVRKEF